MEKYTRKHISPQPEESKMLSRFSVWWNKFIKFGFILGVLVAGFFLMFWLADSAVDYFGGAKVNFHMWAIG